MNHRRPRTAGVSRALDWYHLPNIGWVLRVDAGSHVFIAHCGTADRYPAKIEAYECDPQGLEMFVGYLSGRHFAAMAPICARLARQCAGALARYQRATGLADWPHGYEVTPDGFVDYRGMAPSVWAKINRPPRERGLAPV